MANIRPTRMELLKTKKKLKLAIKGHKLLKEKRDALMMEFFSLIKEIKKLRAEISEKLLLAQKSMQRGILSASKQDIERLTLAMPTGVSVSFGEKTVMGVEILTVDEIIPTQDWYGYHDSPIELDSAVKQFRNIFPEFIRLSEKQMALTSIAKEIKKTKRKVNSLEFIVVPQLEKTVKTITFKLEELARENFTRLKMIKDRTQEHF